MEVCLCPRRFYPFKVHRLRFANVAGTHFLLTLFSVDIVATTTRLYSAMQQTLLFSLDWVSGIRVHPIIRFHLLNLGGMVACMV